MTKETHCTWMFADELDNLVGTVRTEKLRALGCVLPPTLPDVLPLLFHSAEDARAWAHRDWRFDCLRIVPVKCNAMAFVTVRSVTKDEDLVSVHYKGDDTDWKNVPLSMPGGSGKSGFSDLHFN